MLFLKSQKRFDFLYDGKPFSELDFTVEQTEKENSLTTVYKFSDGLCITNFAYKRDDAYEWVNYFENTSEEPTKIISALYDACVELPLYKEKAVPWTAFAPGFSDVTAVFAPKGSTWDFDEFSCDTDIHSNNRYKGHLPVGTTKKYGASGGRSSENSAPFFNIHKNGKGYICAIGWTGQWNCEITRNEETVTVKSKIEDTHFRLLPGEKIRTSSFVVMPYDGTVIQSHNKWRRLLKKHYSLIGKEGRDIHGPLCAGVWGGMKTSSVLERINSLNKWDIPVEYIWMDAGWYGADTKPTPDEFEGDWPTHTGDWRVSPLIHTNNLKDVSAAVHKEGKKFLLWFEVERINKNVPIYKEHPEYFFKTENPDGSNRILNLGNEDAWNYCFKTLSGLIEDIGIDCYRQDFNTSPLSDWRFGDAEDRQGISEIKHICGMYRLWDELLKKFPNLIIDNCASGGRRIDIETLKRSIPLWRSDYQCPANFLPEGSQCHNISFNTWMPYSGTSSGRFYDTYRMRSAYSPALTTNYTFSERDCFGDDPKKMKWLKKYLHEYLRVRPFMSEDFYPLTQISDRTDIWCASQFHRPKENDGILIIFRRENSPYETAEFNLYDIDESAVYTLEDADADTEVVSGKELANFKVTLENKYSSKIYFYKKR